MDGLQLLLQLKCTEGGLGSHLVNVLFKKNVRELMSWGTYHSHGVCLEKKCYLWGRCLWGRKSCLLVGLDCLKLNWRRWCGRCCSQGRCRRYLPVGVVLFGLGKYTW